MQPLSDKRDRTWPSSDIERAGPGAGPGPGSDLLVLLVGAATAAAGTGTLLALADSTSPLRGPFTLFFLLAAPALALARLLRALDPLGRAIAALGGAIVLDILVAQTLLALHQWSVRGGIVAVAAISALLLLPVPLWRLRGRGARRRGI
ncbi:hypothetical protein RKD23_005974 [Streptomyces sp. SAI-170]|uniref:hypothetical protein n=1 Tax=Streptomyces sp. SAI-170 TaxID=3377729 RepID=UPI003C7CF24D